MAHYDETWRQSVRADDLSRLAALGEGVEDTYCVEYAKSGRAKCKGRKPCNGTKIAKGVLRLGVWVDTGAEWGSSWMWRHWGCVTDRQLANISLVVGGQASGLKGWDALDSEDQHIVQTALNRGRIDNDDRSELAPPPSPPPMSTRRSSRHKEHAEYESRYGKGTPAVAVEADVTEEEREQAGEGPSEVKPALEAPVELVKVEAGGVAAPGDDDELDVDVKEEDAKEEIGGSAGSVNKKRARGCVEGDEIEEQQDVKPELGDEQGDVKPGPKTRGRGKKEPKIQPADEIPADLLEDNKPKRSTRSRKPPAHPTDQQFVHGA